MDWQLFAQLLAAHLVAFLGWWVAHTFSSRRDIANERRKLMVGYLLEAYRKLESAANPSDPLLKRTDLESAIADVQLLGSPSQVTMARAFAKTIANDGSGSLDELLFDLRNSLRQELRLESIDCGIDYLRLGDKKAPCPKASSQANCQTLGPADCK